MSKSEGSSISAITTAKSAAAPNYRISATGEKECGSAGWRKTFITVHMCTVPHSYLLVLMENN